MGTKTSAIATLVERQTRYCQLVALPDGFRADRVRERLAHSITTLPKQLRRSLTWDQALEMAEHRRFGGRQRVAVYSCDPRGPWQPGSNENTNGLLRQYFPRGRSLAGVAQQRLDEVAAKLNGRPPQDARLDDPGGEALRAARGPQGTLVRALISLGLRPRSTALGPRWDNARRQGWCADPLRSRDTAPSIFRKRHQKAAPQEFRM